ncbi:MAG TPA: redoxin domain-containing protein [candidate division Zixibacteria bacterium]|nr:redoxin domain-containing protein [candidate division Zixibacteria bacterium]
MLTALLLLSCGGEKKVESKIEAEGPRIPNFTAIDANGQKFTQDDISDGPAVACFLVSWCLTCGYELVALQEIRDEFAEYNFPIVVFSFEEPAEFKELMDSLMVDLPIVKADSALFAGLRIDAIPTRILLSDGREAMRITGAPSFEDEAFRKMLRKAVGLPPEGKEVVAEKKNQ